MGYVLAIILALFLAKAMISRGLDRPKHKEDPYPDLDPTAPDGRSVHANNWAIKQARRDLERLQEQQEDLQTLLALRHVKEIEIFNDQMMAGLMIRISYLEVSRKNGVLHALERGAYAATPIKGVAYLRNQARLGMPDRTEVI